MQSLNLMRSGAFIHPKPMMHIAYPSISANVLNSPLFSFNLGFLHNLRFFLPIFTMMHLCIMLWAVHKISHAIFRPILTPPSCHTLSHIRGPPQKYVTHLGQDV